MKDLKKERNPELSQELNDLKSRRRYCIPTFSSLCCYILTRSKRLRMGDTRNLIMLLKKVLNPLYRDNLRALAVKARRHFMEHGDDFGGSRRRLPRHGNRSVLCWQPGKDSRHLLMDTFLQRGLYGLDYLPHFKGLPY